MGNEHKRFRVARIEPEFYFHFKTSKSLDYSDLDKLNNQLEIISKQAFGEFYPDIKVDFDINLELGSIRGWIRLDKKALAGILIGTGVFVSQYGSLRSGAETIWDDFTWVLDHIKASVETTVDRDAGIETQIRTERRRGAVARLDRLIYNYQHGDISEEEYWMEATAILRAIQHSDDQNEILPALSEYARAKDEGWQELFDRIASDSNNPRPPLHEDILRTDAIRTRDERKRLSRGHN